MNKMRKAYQNFYDNIIKGGTQQFDMPHKYDFKGQRYDENKYKRSPGLTREQAAQYRQLDEELKPQTRELRMKNAFYMGVYMSWFAGVVLFIMYRLGGDELGVMEKEANERLRLKDQLKKERALQGK